MNEEMGEARTESLVRDAGEAVVGVAGESGAWGGSMTHRDRLLEDDADAAARGVFDGPFGLVIEVIVQQTVAGRSQGGEMGAGARATHPSDRRTWPRSTRRTMEGGIAWMWRNGGRECVCVCAFAKGRNVCSERERVRFLTRKGTQKCSLLCQWALTERRTLGRVGAPQRGHGAPLEPLAQLGDALGGVGAIAIPVEAAELV